MAATRAVSECLDPVAYSSAGDFLFSLPDPVDATGETWDEVGDELKAGHAGVFLDLSGTEMVSEEDGAGQRTRPWVHSYRRASAT